MEDNKITPDTIEKYLREHLSSLSDDILNICHSEYIKRWRGNNKDKVREYNINYSKKNKITPTNNEDNTLNNKITSKLNPLHISRT